MTDAFGIGGAVLLDLETAERMGPAPSRELARKEVCVVFPETARAACCGLLVVHPADVFIRLACGCAFTYCTTALTTIYGRVKMREAMCPTHANSRQRILVANWLGQ